MSRLMLAICCALAAVGGFWNEARAQVAGQYVKAAPAAATSRPLDARTLRPTEKNIIKALGSPTAMEVVDTPLSNAIDYLKEYHQIDIQFDNKALEEASIIPAEITVTKTVNGITLASALDLLLRSTSPELAYMIKDEVLLITTKNALSAAQGVAFATIETHAYEVPEGRDADKVVKLIGEVLRYHHRAQVKIGLKTAEIIEPEVTLFEDKLVVNASLPEHQVVDELLNELRPKAKPASE